MLRQRARLAVLQFMLCSLGSIGLGYSYFGNQIFDPKLTYFQFVLFGVLASVFIAAIPLVKWRWLVPLAVVSFMGVIFLTKSITPLRVTRDAVWVLVVIAAVWLGLKSNRAFPSLKVGKFVIWSAIFSATHTCAVFMLILITTHSTTANPEFLVMNARIGALLGAGVGLGYELSKILAARVWHNQEAVAGRPG